jgi:ribA/ribD-fused uncharacterized protein
MIGPFRGKYRFLSNFYPCQIEWKGLVYKSTEAAYQASKSMDPEFQKLLTLANPDESKRLGRTCFMRRDWDRVKNEVMLQILRVKFSKEPLRTLLLDTGEEELAELNHWNDRYWGVDLLTGEGQNHLGKTLMQVRQELRTASP